MPRKRNQIIAVDYIPSDEKTANMFNKALPKTAPMLRPDPWTVTEVNSCCINYSVSCLGGGIDGLSYLAALKREC